MSASLRITFAAPAASPTGGGSMTVPTEMRDSAAPTTQAVDGGTIGNGQPAGDGAAAIAHGAQHGQHGSTTIQQPAASGASAIGGGPAQQPANTAIMIQLPTANFGIGPSAVGGGPTATAPQQYLFVGTQPLISAPVMGGGYDPLSGALNQLSRTVTGGTGALGGPNPHAGMENCPMNGDKKAGGAGAVPGGKRKKSGQPAQQMQQLPQGTAKKKKSGGAAAPENGGKTKRAGR